MERSWQEFVADDGWLVIAIVSVAVVSLAGVAGLEALAGALSIIGLVLLVPLFLFWGEEIAAVWFDESPAAAQTDRQDSPLEELKRRYAAGEIDDAEFERRLERLVAVDGIPPDAVSSAENGESRETGGRSRTASETRIEDTHERDR